MSVILFFVFCVIASTRSVIGGNYTTEVELIDEEKIFVREEVVRTVGLTLLAGAGARGAVCLDGSLPGYHLDRGVGIGARSWLIQLEGGGWCNTVRSCVFRKTTRRGSSKFMEKELPFTGILSNNKGDNPDFYNWNRVKLRYCDGASFTGDSQNQNAELYFRGQRIWSYAMEVLMEEGMSSATEALLSGCSAGGLAAIIHCDEFRAMFPRSTKVKCLSDAGLFLDVEDVSGGRSLRDMFSGVVAVQSVEENLPRSCTIHLDATSCFFPQNLINNIQTPMFILNTAYDVWQLQASLAPPAADRGGAWIACKQNFEKCNSYQMGVLQNFRNEMLRSLYAYKKKGQNGVFINSCFAHCQSERQDTWYAPDSPRFGNKRVAEAVGAWYFDRSMVMSVDCPYPCDATCHNLVSRGI